MNRSAAKGIAVFLLLMLFFTFATHHLNGLRTPWVLCVAPKPGVIDGRRYDAVVPLESVFSGETAYVYVVEDTLSYFQPMVARQATVRVVASADGSAAVDGLYRDARVVRYASRGPLTGNTIPVRVWEEETP